MGFLWDGIRQGFDLIIHGDPYTIHLIWVTLHVAAVSTGVALVLGLPLGLLLGLGTGHSGAARQRRRPRTAGAPGAWALTLGNAGLGLPPVIVGLVLSLLMFPAAPLGSLHLLFTLKGVIIAQTVLALPVIVALTAVAVRSLPPGLLAQARALGAGTPQVWLLALREARIGVMAATIAALGSALSEVGAVVLVGGNIEGSTQTLASAALEQVDAGHYAEAMAIGMILLGLILIVMAALTAIQLGGARSGRGRGRAPAT
ncbi:MAG: ABC transporter permease [Solirubrobacteraceae bacterium]